MKKKVIRLSTSSISLDLLLNGQCKYLSGYYEVIGVSSPGEHLDKVKEREGIKTIGIPMERRICPVKDLISLFRLITVFLKERPYVVHSITPKAGLLSMIAARITRVPVRIHTFTGLIFPSAKGFTRKILIAADRLTCLCATKIIPEGEGVKRDLIRFRITEKPLRVLANGNVNGIDLDYFSLSDSVLKNAAAYRRADLFTFCFIGRMVKDKGVNELIRAFIRLYTANKRTRLLLIGPFEKTPLDKNVKDAIHRHPGITYLDFQKDIRPFLAASDALVLPSYREGFPNVVLQAGAMGLPSIVTDINGSNEIILSGENGIIIPPENETALYDAMVYFTKNPDKVKRMASHARELIAGRYEQKIVWKALLDEYRFLSEK